MPNKTLYMEFLKGTNSMSKLTPESRAAKRWYREYGRPRTALVIPPTNHVTAARRNEAMKQLLAHPDTILHPTTQFPTHCPSFFHRILAWLGRPFKKGT